MKDMDAEDSDIGFIASFYHASWYALSHALTKVVGPAQAVFLKEYANSLQELLTTGGGDYAKLLRNLESYGNVLKDRELVEGLRVEDMGGNRVKMIVNGCAFSKLVHPTLKVEGSRDFLCPIIAMAMVALAIEKGLKKGDDIFDYIKFEENLSYITQNGAETVFHIVKK